MASLESVAAVGGNALAADPAGTGSGFDSAVTKVTTSGAIVRLPVTVAYPAAVAADAAGNVYVGDNKLCVGIGGCTRVPVSIFQKIATDGTIVPIPLLKSSDHSDLEIQYVSGIAIDATGTIFFSDYVRGTIRKLTLDGDVTAVAGMPGAQAEVDGIGGAARFAGPAGIALDSAGNLFVADDAGNTIRKVTPTGKVTTVAGQPSAAGDADGPALLATFSIPRQIAVDSRGNVYVADWGNALIRKLSPAGVVSTVAGTRGQLGFQAGPAPGVIDRPSGVAVISNDVAFAQATRIGVLRSPP